MDWADSRRERDLEYALRCVFVENEFEIFGAYLGQRRNDLFDSVVDYGVTKGWLEAREPPKGSNWTREVYHLTEAGKKHFEIE